MVLFRAARGEQVNNIFALKHPTLKAYLADHHKAKHLIYDRGEVRRIGRLLCLSPEAVRNELVKLGYIKVKNRHGIAIWQKKQGAEILC